MHGTRGISAPVEGRTPGHLRGFRDGMGEAGIRVRLPAGSDRYELPKPAKLPGKPVSEIVIEARRRPHE